MDCDFGRTHICKEDFMNEEELSIEKNHGFLSDIFISEEKINEIMGKMPLTGTAGPDGIPSILLNKCKDTLSLPITILWRLSFENGRDPKRLKESFVFPQLKDGAIKTTPSSWRPISHTLLLSIIFE